MFHNPGHIYFEGINGIDGCPLIKNCDYFYPRMLDEEGNQITDDNGDAMYDESDDAEIVSECGVNLGITVGEIKANKGTVRIDGEYNTWYTKEHEDLTSSEVDAVVRYYEEDTILNKDDIALLFNMIELQVSHSLSVCRIFEKIPFSYTLPEDEERINNLMIENGFEPVFEN